MTTKSVIRLTYHTSRKEGEGPDAKTINGEQTTKLFLAEDFFAACQILKTLYPEDQNVIIVGQDTVLTGVICVPNEPDKELVDGDGVLQYIELEPKEEPKDPAVAPSFSAQASVRILVADMFWEFDAIEDYVGDPDEVLHQYDAGEVIEIKRAISEPDTFGFAFKVDGKLQCFYFDTYEEAEKALEDLKQKAAPTTAVGSDPAKEAEVPAEATAPVGSEPPV